MSEQDDGGRKHWADAVEHERNVSRTDAELAISMVISGNPHLFGISKAEAKRMGPQAIRRRAAQIVAAVDTGTNLMMIKRPDTKAVNPFFFWKQTWNHFRALGDVRVMLFSRDIYVALTRHAHPEAITEMDLNVDFSEQEGEEPEPSAPIPGTGLRVVK